MTTVPVSSLATKKFVLKDSDPELIEAINVEPQGRIYSKFYTDQPGAVRIDDVVSGMKYASLAITDDKEGTLEKVGKGNPWHIEALKVITGSEGEAYKPLSHILATHMDLTLDKYIDVSGFTPAGHVLDTQGYIAHNDTTIVVAFRCTTSFKDWLTNLSTTSSAWELDEDLDQGYSGWCSSLDGLCCSNDYKPRVHTGFYNNFLATAPILKEYIDPLLQPDQPARKLFVVGHSLGGGIASLATCYFLLEYDWPNLPHKLISVTAGSPRSCLNSMCEIIDAKINELRPLDKAVVCRLVLDKDVVPKVPPSIFGFKHIGKLVYITEDEELLINPKLDSDHKIDDKEIEELAQTNPALLEEEYDNNENEDTTDVQNISSYDKFVSKIPKSFRDHMPDFYLNPLLKIFDNEYGIVRESSVSCSKKCCDGENESIITYNSSIITGASSKSKKKSRLRRMMPSFKRFRSSKSKNSCEESLTS